MTESTTASGCCALVPIKARRLCKTRLRRRLSGSARANLAREMLTRVLAAVRASDCVGSVLVVSPERDLLPRDIGVLTDSGHGLNEALELSRDVLRARGFDELLVVAADLPCVSGFELDELVRAGRAGGFALAPDRSGRGTNALYLRVDRPFDFHFGDESRASHLEEARRRGLPARLHRSSGLAFDVDVPSDLAEMPGAPWQTLLRA